MGVPPAAPALAAAAVGAVSQWARAPAAAVAGAAAGEAAAAPRLRRQAAATPSAAGQDPRGALAGPACAAAAAAALAGRLLPRGRRSRRQSTVRGRRPARGARALTLLRRALRWEVAESAKQDLSEAVAELISKTTSGGAAGFGLLVVPPRCAGQLAEASQQLRAAGALPESAPLLALQSGSGESLQLGLASGEGSQAAAFFVNKEEQSQAGAGLARENPVPGVPDGNHGTILLFADSKVPGALTKNLLEALDSRYPRATKAGVVVLPGRLPSAAGESKEAEEEEDWEPPREGRQLRPRERSDGHGWIKGDPTWRSSGEAADSAETIQAEFKRRPFGVKRYTPGVGGKGAMIMDMFEKERYKGDALGQAAVKGVRTGMAIKAVAGKDVRTWDFEDIMGLLGDEGVLDPDSKSAASWGKGGQVLREKVPAAELPFTVEYMLLEVGGGGGKAALCLNGVPKREGTLGLALAAASSSALDLVGCQPLGPMLEVAKAGPSPEGGFAVASVTVSGKEMAAASALKGVAKAAGLESMKGISVGVVRPQATASGQPSACTASQWAVFPMVGVNKAGGLVLRCKGLAAEGLGPDDGLKRVQFFRPAAEEGSGALGRLAGLAGAGAAGGLAFATGAEALRGAPQGTLGLVGGAVLGAAGGGGGAGGGAPTVLHRSAAALVQFAGP